MSDVTRLVRVGDMTIEGRTVHGTVMPYNQTAWVKDPGTPAYQERFAPGSFKQSIGQRGDKVRLFGMHSRAMGGFPIGKPVDWEDTDDRLRGAFEVFDTSDGNDALTLAREGGFTGFSVGFGVLDGGTRRDGDVVTRTQASLGEVSLVDIPAYPGATLDGVRMALDDLDGSDVAAFFHALTEPARAAFIEYARSLDTEDAASPDDASPDTRDGDEALLIAAARLRLITLKG